MENNSLIYSLAIMDKDNGHKDAGTLISSIPSLSSRRNAVRLRLNELLSEQPELANVAYALLTFATQKWASEQRSKIGIDRTMSRLMRKELVTASQILGALSSRTGLTPVMKGESDTTVASDDLLSCVEEAVEWIGKMPGEGKILEKMLRAVHFMDFESGDVSNYIIDKYYKSAILILYDGYGEEIERLISTASAPGRIGTGNLYTEDYHDTIQLLSLYPPLMFRYSRRAERNLSDAAVKQDMDSLILLQKLEDAVCAVNDYPDNGPQMFRILRGLMEGKTNTKICTELRMKREPFLRKRSEAINLLSFVLWGYSTSEILEGLVYAPLSKKDLRYIS